MNRTSGNSSLPGRPQQTRGGETGPVSWWVGHPPNLGKVQS